MQDIKLPVVPSGSSVTRHLSPPADGDAHRGRISLSKGARKSRRFKPKWGWNRLPAEHLVALSCVTEAEHDSRGHERNVGGNPFPPTQGGKKTRRLAAPVWSSARLEVSGSAVR